MSRELRYEDAAEHERAMLDFWRCVECEKCFPVSEGEDQGHAERLARWCCSTSLPCDCGGRREKSHACCEECRAERRRARHEKLPLVEWDGDSPLYDDREQEFLDEGAIEDRAWEWCEDDHPRLTPCKHVEPPLFSIYDFLQHEFDSEYDLPDGWEEAEAAVNDYVRSIRSSLNWVPDRTKRIDWRTVKKALGVDAEEE